LGAVAKVLNHGADTVKQLEASLYSGSAHNWQGADLHQLVRQGLQAKENKLIIQKIELAPLYPN